MRSHSPAHLQGRVETMCHVIAMYAEAPKQFSPIIELLEEVADFISKNGGEPREQENADDK